MKKKKWIVGMLIGAVVLAFAGCKDADTGKADSARDAAQATEAAAEAGADAEAEVTGEAEEKEARYAPYFTDAPFEASGVVWIAGDSIASPHDDNEYQVPISGWGQYLADYLSADAEVHNEARSGRSSKSYLQETNYKTVMSQIGYGDYLFIAFGLNDEKADSTKLYTDPDGDSDTEGSFAWYLKNKYIEPALSVGAEPVLMSPVVRAIYNEDGTLDKQTQLPYVESIERLIDEYKEQGIDLYYIDLYEITDNWYGELGEEGVMQLHGVDNEGSADTTHFSEEGSDALAKLIVEEIKRQQMELDVFVME